jgi:hypothetical protein
MHPKIKSRPTGAKSRVSGVEPLKPHETTRQTASINEAPGRGMIANQSSPHTTIHARHHSSIKTQS